MEDGQTLAETNIHALTSYWAVWKAEELILLWDRCHNCSQVSSYNKYKPWGLPSISDLCSRVVFEAEKFAHKHRGRHWLWEKGGYKMGKGKSLLRWTDQSSEMCKGVYPVAEQKVTFHSSGVTESVPLPSVSALAGKAVAKPSSRPRLWLRISPAHV